MGIDTSRNAGCAWVTRDVTLSISPPMIASFDAKYL